ACGRGIHRGDPATGGENTVERRGRSTALNVPEHRGTRLEAGALLDLPLQAVADAAEALVAELVLAAGRKVHRSLTRRRSLRHHDDREVTPAGMAAVDHLAHLLDVKGALWDQDHVRAAREAGVQCNPARMAPHYL